MTLNCEVLLTKWGKFRKRTFSVKVTASSTTRADTSLELPLSTSNKFLSWCEYLSFSCHKCWHKRLILILCYNYIQLHLFLIWQEHTSFDIRDSLFWRTSKVDVYSLYIQEKCDILQILNWNGNNNMNYFSVAYHIIMPEMPNVYSHEQVCISRSRHAWCWLFL